MSDHDDGTAEVPLVIPYTVPVPPVDTVRIAEASKLTYLLKHSSNTDHVERILHVVENSASDGSLVVLTARLASLRAMMGDTYVSENIESIEP